MKYFCSYEEYDGVAYHEFCKGERKEGNVMGHKDSLMLHDDLLKGSGLDKIFENCICDYDGSRAVTVMPDEWADVMWDANKKGGMAAEIIAEIEPWMKEALDENGYFTIFGI